MIHNVLLGLALLAPADTPIEPIDVATITAGLALPEAVQLCTTTGETGASINTLADIAGPDVGVMLKDMAVGYFTDMFEDGMGPNQAMTPEAEAAFEVWITGCLA